MRRRDFLRTLPVGLLLGATELVGCDDDEEDRSSQGLVSAGDSCPAFKCDDLNGVTHAFPVSGKPSVLFFFDTNCPDCNQQFPVVNELFELYGSQAEFLAVSRGETGEVVSAYLEKYGYTIPTAADGTRSVYQQFARSGVPRVYFMRNEKVMFLSDDRKLLSLDEGIEYVESLLRFYQL